MLPLHLTAENLTQPFMSLYTQLQQVKSEEDVKDAYIKAMELKGYTKGLIDIQTKVGVPDRFESDFMVQYLAGITWSAEAQAVLNAGRVLWQAYFFHTNVRSVRDQYKLNRPDVGWYQVRNALAARNASGNTAPVNFGLFEQAYQTLSDKLRPQVFTLGFLR